MSTRLISSHGSRGAGARLLLLMCMLAGVSSTAFGAPPIDPLPSPTFSFRLNSPTVFNGQVGADEMLLPVPPDIDLVFGGWVFGLGVSTDELDAISVGNAQVLPDAPFALLFSVDAGSVGMAEPDAHFVSLGVPYNALDQAARGQSAGDQFMSTTLHTQTVVRGVVPSVEILNNVLVRNNFDEGGTDFVALPTSSAGDVIDEDPQDEVDATAVIAPDTAAVYFSVSSGSPSLAGLHGRPFPSGADVFVFAPPQVQAAGKRWAGDSPGAPARGGREPTCQAGCCAQGDAAYDECIALGGSVEDCAELAHDVLRNCLWVECGITPPPPPGLYVSALDLGLRQCDDIDGMIVFDVNEDGLFNGTDRILFSLTADSPSLETIPGVSLSGAAADIFIMAPDAEEPALFATAATLGLGHPNDNIDALDYTLCDNVDSCAAAHGIRLDNGIPALSTWGICHMTLLLLIAGTIVLARQRLPVRQVEPAQS